MKVKCWRVEFHPIWLNIYNLDNLQIKSIDQFSFQHFFIYKKNIVSTNSRTNTRCDLKLLTVIMPQES